MANKSKSYPVNEEKFVEVIARFQEMPTIRELVAASGIPARRMYERLERYKKKQKEKQNEK